MREDECVDARHENSGVLGEVVLSGLKSRYIVLFSGSVCREKRGTGMTKTKQTRKRWWVNWSFGDMDSRY